MALSGSMVASKWQSPQKSAARSVETQEAAVEDRTSKLVSLKLSDEHKELGLNTQPQTDHDKNQNREPAALSLGQVSRPDQRLHRGSDPHAQKLNINTLRAASGEAHAAHISGKEHPGIGHLEGIIEPLHKPFEANNKSEIVSELSHNASESQINEPKKIERLEN